MLNVDSTGIGARQITHQLLVGRRILIRILGDNIQKLLRFRLQMGRCQFLGIFVGLLGVDQRPDILPDQLLGTLPHRRLHSLEDGFLHAGK